MSIFHTLFYVGKMLFRGLTQLIVQMIKRTLGKKVYGFTAAIINPINRQMTVDKSENLYSIKFSHGFCPTTNKFHSTFLTVRNTCRCHLNTIHSNFLKKRPCNIQFLIRSKRYAAGLFAIT